jgi:tetratricopeptide (TPR) repeat protein
LVRNPGGSSEASSRFANDLPHCRTADRKIRRHCGSAPPGSPEVLAWPPAPLDDAATHYHLGDTLKEKGDLDGAIAEYRTTIGQRANYPEGHANLGVALKAKGDLDGAIAEWGTAIRQRPNYLEVQPALDKALAAKGKSGP